MNYNFCFPIVCIHIKVHIKNVIFNMVPVSSELALEKISDVLLSKTIKNSSNRRSYVV